MLGLHKFVLILCVAGAIADASAQGFSATKVGLMANAYGLNNLGQVAGSAGTVFETGPNGQGVTLIEPNPSSSIVGGIINDYGQVTGTVRSSQVNQVFISGPNGHGPAALINFPGSDSVYAGSINNSGQVAVLDFPALGGSPAVLITGANGQGLTQIVLPTDVSSMGGNLAMNNSGQVVGSALAINGQSRSQGFFLTQSNGQNAQYFGNGGQPMSINASGQVVGINNSLGRAFITGANGLGMTIIGTLAQGTYSNALGINDEGVVVGTSTLSNNLGLAGFVYGLNGQGLVDLNSMVSLPGGVQVNEALSINNKNQILVSGSDLNYYLLSPIPEPSVAILMIIGLGAIGAVRKRHVAFLHDEWSDG